MWNVGRTNDTLNYDIAYASWDFNSLATPLFLKQLAQVNCNLVVLNPENFYADNIGNLSEMSDNMGDLTTWKYTT